jgi:hypothetical protein
MKRYGMAVALIAFAALGFAAAAPADVKITDQATYTRYDERVAGHLHVERVRGQSDPESRTSRSMPSLTVRHEGPSDSPSQTPDTNRGTRMHRLAVRGRRAEATLTERQRRVPDGDRNDPRDRAAVCGRRRR